MKVKPLNLIFGIIISPILIFICAFLGITLKNNLVFNILGIVGFLYLVTTLLYNIIKQSKYKKQYLKEEQIDIMYNKSITYQNEAKDFKYVYDKVNKKIKTNYLFVAFHLISLMLLLTCIFSIEFINIIYVVIILCLMIIDTVFSIIGIRSQFDFSKDMSKDYPYVKSILERCKEKLNVKDNIKLEFLFGDNIGVEKIGSSSVLKIGIGDLNVLSEIELENIIYHELAHIYNEDTVVSYKVIKKANVFKELTMPTVSIGFNCLFFMYISNQVNEEVEMFLHFIRIDREKKADLAVLEYGDKQVYINGLAKSSLGGFQDQSRFGFLVYESEKPLEDYIEKFISARIKNYLDKKEMYDHFIYSCLQRKFDTHPSFKKRMEALGVETFEINFDVERSPEYSQEINKINAKFNKEWYDREVKNWEQNREYHYLYYLKEYNEYKDKELLSLSFEEQMKLAFCYSFFNETEKALKLYNHLYETSPNNVFVLQNRAIAKYALNDLSCIEDFEKASSIEESLIEQNNFYVGSILSCNGMEKEIEEYRKRTLVQMKRVLNNTKYSYAKKQNAYEENDLTEEQRLIVKEEITKYPEIKEAYLLKYYVNEEKYQYYLAVMFDKKEKKERITEVMDDLFIFAESVSDYRLTLNNLTGVPRFINFVKKKKIKDLTK